MQLPIGNPHGWANVRGRTLGFAPTLLLRPSKFEGHCPMIRHGCRMALMVAL
ncbi:MAG: hypothetical protein BECKG1743D_GA0114223_109661, partial [Candidatus Kentron sp. G]